MKQIFINFVNDIVENSELKTSIIEGYSLLYESPVGYDEDTKDLHIANSDWSTLPPTHADISTIVAWVKMAQARGILDSSIIGRGVDKIVLMNDNKTVFKFSQTVGEEQIYVESQIYKKYGKKYAGLLAKIYKAGDHWSIQEYAEKINGFQFSDMIGLTDIDLVYKHWSDIFSVGSLISEHWNKIKLILDTKNPEELLNKEYPDILKQCPNFIQIAKLPKVAELINFCYDSKVTLADMTFKQFGNDNGRLVLFDYGMLYE